MKAKEAMHKGVEWVGPYTPATELAKLMRNHDQSRATPKSWGARARAHETSAYALGRGPRQALGTLRQ
jgi:hypothetical protein